jgi:hypothetical protein
MATVNTDGSPHNTPFHYLVDDFREHLYWSSSPTSAHSQNLARTGQAFIVIYEPGQGGGLYMQAENSHEVSGDELEQGLAVWNAKRVQENRLPLGAGFFTGSAMQRMYCTDLVRFWVNYSEKDESGNILRDVRQEISREDLLT